MDGSDGGTNTKLENNSEVYLEKDFLSQMYEKIALIFLVVFEVSDLRRILGLTCRHELIFLKK